MVRKRLFLFLNYRSGSNLLKLLLGAPECDFLVGSAGAAESNKAKFVNPHAQPAPGGRDDFLLQVVGEKWVCRYAMPAPTQGNEERLAWYTYIGDWWGNVRGSEVPRPYDGYCETRWGPEDIRRLLSLGEDWKFLYLIRDGRDYLESTRRVPGGYEEERNRESPEDYFLFLCRGWRNRARIALDCQSAFPERYRILRYEELVAAPIEAVDRVLSWAGLRYNRDFGEKSLALLEAVGTRERHSSFSSGPGARWARWTPRERAVFEREAGKELEELGYSWSLPSEDSLG